ncbi:MAG: hypothetical protein R3349_12675, partial [Geminicoccaceae bacterium]|nr:hypothetical protein [Geminicoccaceae bacterium]
VELIRFAKEVVITAPTGQVFVLRGARPDDQEEAGIRVTDGAGATIGHDILLETLAPAVADEQPAARMTVGPGDDGIVLWTEGARIGLRVAGPDAEDRSIACAPSGEAVDWRLFAGALLGAPPDLADGSLEAERHDAADRAGSPPPTPAAGVPDHISFDDQGFIDLGWLAELIGGLGDAAIDVHFGGLPETVRLSAGVPADTGWRIGREEIHGLAMFATPEGLKPFTLELRVEPLGSPATSWSIPVLPAGAAETEASPEQPLTVALEFPPPFSPRNRLDYFAVVMIEGLPRGATLSAGVPSAVGRWTLAPDDLRELRAHLPAGITLPCSVEVAGITIENREGMLSSARRTLTIGAGAGQPQAGPPPTVAEVDLQPLLAAAGPDRRVDAVALTGVPPVVALSSGTHDRVSDCWVLRANELSGVTMTVRDPALRRLSLKARAIVIDGKGGASAISHAIEVEIPEEISDGLEPVDTGPGFFRSLSERRT